MITPEARPEIPAGWYKKEIASIHAGIIMPRHWFYRDTSTPFRQLSFLITKTDKPDLFEPELVIKVFPCMGKRVGYDAAKLALLRMENYLAAFKPIENMHEESQEGPFIINQRLFRSGGYLWERNVRIVANTKTGTLYEFDLSAPVDRNLETVRETALTMMGRAELDPTY